MPNIDQHQLKRFGSLLNPDGSLVYIGWAEGHHAKW
jgi:hypothetical protein